MNAELQEIHSMLGAIVADLSSRLGRTADRDEARALLLEIQECVHRLNLIQQLLFVQLNDEIAEQAVLVKSAASQVRTVIAQIGRVESVVKGITSFLGELDKLIDLAKKVAVM